MIKEHENYIEINTKRFGAPQADILAWVKGLPNAIESEAFQQLQNLSSLPFLFKHVAVMPDVHYGRGSTVGSVFATQGAIIPAAVGVDIGCGMMAVKLNLKASQLPDNLLGVRSAIELMVPHGRTDNGALEDKGSFSQDFANTHPCLGAFKGLEAVYNKILLKHPLLIPKKHPLCHLGTLGTGNHFIEMCLDENQDVWVLLHSGSRGIGNKIGTYFIGKAKEEMRKYHITPYLPDQDLSYLVEHTELYHDYVMAMHWAQNFAQLNRETLMKFTLKAIRAALQLDTLEIIDTGVNCHHNYVNVERHFGHTVLLTRKGAIAAYKDQLGIIPGSMGAASFIVRGLGNRDSFCSASHGAGRTMSRTEALKTFTIDDHALATEGIECRKDSDVLDETPGAYKDINLVINAQKDLVEIVHTLHQIVNVK